MLGGEVSEVLVGHDIPPSPELEGGLSGIDASGSSMLDCNIETPCLGCVPPPLELGGGLSVDCSVPPPPELGVGLPTSELKVGPITVSSASLSHSPELECCVVGNHPYKGKNLRFAELSDTEFSIQVHEEIVASGVHNFVGCQIPVRSKINIEFLRQELVDYPDKAVVDLLEFGFPLGVSGDLAGNSPGYNHGGATRFPVSVASYVRKELSEGAIVGPFQQSPWSSSSVFSPLSTTEKKDCSERRIIMDLSFPPGNSVNDLISTTEYLGAPMRLRYPSVDDLVSLIKKKGKGCALMKRDLSRAFRQFFVDPGEIHLLGFSWEESLFYDQTLPML